MVELVPLPPLEAIRAFEARKPDLVGTFSYLDMWQEEHATSFTVAKSAGFDILKDISDGFERALNEGQTPRQFATELRPLLQAKGWWGKKLLGDPETGDLVTAQLGSDRRLKTIFDANMRTSYAAGHWASFERNKASRPYLRYVALLDNRTRPAHRARHNLVLPVDDPYWDTWATPCGWNCRCTMQSLSQRDIDQLIREGEQLMFVAPQDTFRNFTNKRTGEIVSVPDGIDPGWAYNPGRAGYEARVNQALAEKVADAPSDFVTAAVEERLSSEAFERFLRNPQGSMPVMAIPNEIREVLGQDVRVLLFSSETMVRQARIYPELTAADYMAIPYIFASPTLVVEDQELTVILTKIADGQWCCVAFKVTATAKAAFLTSFGFGREEDITRLLKRDGVKMMIDYRD